MPKHQIRKNIKNGEVVSKNIVHPDNISIGYADDTFYTSAGAWVAALAKGAARMRKSEAAKQERRQKLESKKRGIFQDLIPSAQSR
jgi:hypothetical protein